KIGQTALMSRIAKATMIAIVINLPTGDKRIGFGSTLITYPLAMITQRHPAIAGWRCHPRRSFFYCTACTRQKERNAAPDSWRIGAWPRPRARSGYLIRWCGGAECRPEDDRSTRRA